MKQELASNGVPENYLKPFHVNDCLRDLAKAPGFEWTEGHYAVLCDHVHHNLPSTRVSAAAAGVARQIPVGRSRMMFAEETSFMRYQFGSELEIMLAIEKTAERGFQSIKSVISAVSACPSSPFTEKECVEMTGDPLGFGAPPK